MSDAPDGGARFLVSAFWTGCAGPSGIAYEVREWQPRFSNLAVVLTQPGVQGMDPQGGPVTTSNPFPTVGTLSIGRARLRLPYCSFSEIDTWDNPSLCFADTYDVSGAAPHLIRRVVNRPEMLVLQRALHYAAAQDEWALLGYCTSRAVAARLLRSGAGVEGELEVTRRGRAQEMVQTDRGRFKLVRRGGRWYVAGWQPAA